MALTKVSGGILDPGINVAGIVTATGFDGPFTGGSSKHITAGIITATGFDLNGNGDISGNLVIGGNLTANGDFTTLNTTLREVEILRVDANTTAVAGIITQRGSGDIFSAYDTSTEVFKIADGGTVTVTGSNINIEGGSASNSQLKINSTGRYRGVQLDENGTRKAHFQHDATDNKTVVGTAEGTMQFNSGDTPRIILNSSGHWVPYVDSTYDLGISATRWRNVYADNVIVGVGLTLADNIPASFGNSNDLQILHTPSENHFLFNHHTFFKGDVGWGVRNASNQNIIQVSGSDRTVDLYGSTVKVLSTTGVGVTIRQSLYIENAEFNMTTNGNKVLDFETGGSNVVNFRHNPSDSSITTFIKATHGGSLELYDDSDGNVKLTTEGSGVIISGAVRLQGGHTSYIAAQAQPLIYRTASTSGSYPFNGFGHLVIQTRNDGSNRDIIFATGTNSANQIVINSVGDMKIPDGKELQFGGPLDSGDGDLRIHHNATHSFIQNATGDLNIQGDVVRIKKYDGSKTMAAFIQGGQAELYYDTTRRLNTSPTGINVTGEVEASQDYPNFRPVLDFNFAAQKKLDPRITYTRTGTASFIDKFGLVKIVGDNVPRFDHDPITRESKGLLIEESRTNLVTYSHEFDQTNWSNVRTTDSKTVATNDPQGLQTAVKLIANTDNNTHRIDKISLGMATSTAYTFSVWAKAAEYTGVSLTIADSSNNAHGVYFDLSAGTFTIGSNAHTGRMEAYPNGWYRCFATFTTPSSITFQQVLIGVLQNGTTHTYAGNGSSGIYIWGAQLEVGAFPTSYIPTNGSTTTRGQDLVEITEEEFSEFYNRTEGSFASEIMLKPSFPVTGYATVVMSLSDSSYNNRVTLSSSTGSAAFNADVTIGGTNNRAVLGSYTSGSHSIKAAMAYKQADSGGSLNGAAAVTTSPSPGTLPLLTRADIGKDHGNFNPLNGHVKRIMYYSKRLSNNQLRTLTA